MPTRRRSGTPGRSPGTSSARSACRAENRLDPRGRWWDFGGRGVPPRDAGGARRAASTAYLEYVWALPRGESSFVTVVIPELFERRSLLEAAVERRTRVPAQAAAAQGDRRRDHRRAVRAGRGAGRTGAARVPRPRLGRPRRVAARRPVRAHARARGHPRRLLRLRRGRCRAYADDWQRGTCRSRSSRRRYRDLGDPLLRYLRELTAEPGRSSRW